MAFLRDLRVSVVNLSGVPHDEPSKELGPFQLALVVLSVVLLVGLAVDLVVRMPTEISRLIRFVDTGICILLIIDFSWRFGRAPSKLRFMRWGWLDLLSSIPAIEALRWGRLIRIVRVVRLILVLRSYQRVLVQFIQNRRQAGLAFALVLTCLVISFAAIGMLVFEHDPASNIKTAEDALWWAIVTVTTIGYGDRFPVTDAGRLIATGLMICGIGLFGTLSGVAASYFLGTNQSARPDAATTAALESIDARLARLEQRSRHDSADRSSTT